MVDKRAALDAFRRSVSLFDRVIEGDLPPRSVGQCGKAYFLFANALAASGATDETQATRTRLLNLTQKHPDVFSKAPASEWVSKSRAGKSWTGHAVRCLSFDCALRSSHSLVAPGGDAHKTDGGVQRHRAAIGRSSFEKSNRG